MNIEEVTSKAIAEMRRVNTTTDIVPALIIAIALGEVAQAINDGFNDVTSKLHKIWEDMPSE